MDNQTDDHDTGHPQVGTPEELEEALKWLEELTARQGKTAELSNPVPPTSLDSPFRGLIDNDEGELPDWLREVPKATEPDNFDAEEPESRLDWLAKMAQRESIEELPTLEWRRLSDPIQSTLAPEHQQIINEAMRQESAIDEDEIDEDEEEAFVVTPPISSVTESSEIPELEPVEATFVESVEASTPVDIEEEVTDISAFHEVMSTPVETVVSEDLSKSITLPDDEELPSLDDLDAAMAWIEELAASQEAPIEDVPSVADRALASKLMMEAGITPVVSPLDELGSDSDLMENLTPTHPFIEEEDFADTIVLVETIAADQGTSLDIPEDEPIAVTEPRVETAAAEVAFLGTGDAIEVSVIETPASEVMSDEPVDGLSFEDAMAYLDGLAVAQPTGTEFLETADSNAVSVSAVASIEESAHEGVDLAETEAAIDESLSIDDAPWHDAVAVAAMTTIDEPDNVESKAAEATPEPVTSEPNVVVVGTEAQSDAAEELSPDEEIEATLRALDVIALPPGKSLDGIHAALRAADVAPARDVNAALVWLETVLARRDKFVPDPDTQLEEALIAQMPDDPDAVLAWLEQMASEEPTSAVEPAASPKQAASDESRASYLNRPVVDITEADLLDMPEDPDEAMIWLEGLAGGEPAAARPAVADVDLMTDISVEELSESFTAVELPQESGSSMQDQDLEELFVEQADESQELSSNRMPDSSPLESESRQSTAPTEQPSGPDWIDLLKPLE